MVRKLVLPAMSAEMKFYAESMNSVSKPPKFLKDRSAELSKLIDQVYTHMLDLENAYQDVLTEKSSETAGRRMYGEINDKMNLLRSNIDRYEVIASKEFYHIPSYEEMLFSL